MNEKAGSDLASVHSQREAKSDASRSTHALDAARSTIVGSSIALTIPLSLLMLSKLQPWTKEVNA